ncbi:MAG: hypothetical protein ACE5GA_09650, partial [Candidatus Zixiibacteriota bacterium]
GRAPQVTSRAGDVRRRNLERARALQRRRAGLDTTGADTLQEDTEDDNDDDDNAEAPAGPWIGSRVFNLTRVGIKKMTSFLDPISGSFEKSQSLSRNGLRTRPGAGFRFGFTDRIDIPVVPLRRGQVSAFSRSSSWRASSGIKLLSGALSSKIDISESRSSSFPSTGTAGRNIDRTWPRLSIRIGQMRTFRNIWGLRYIQGIYNTIVRKFGPQTSYSRRTTERLDLSTGFPTSKTLDIDRTPILGVTIPLKRQITVTARVESTRRERERFQSQSGALTSVSVEENKSMRVSTSYSFRSPGGIKIPIFGRIRLQSNVTINLDVLKRTTETQTAGADRVFSISSRRETFTVTSNMSYSFSSQVSGGMSTVWTDTSDQNRRKTHTRELRIFAQMRF